MADSEARGPRDILESYMLAYNSHDAEAVLALYADDATMHVPGLLSVSGKDEIRALIEYDLTLNIRMLISKMRAEDDNATCMITERNDWLRAAGIEEARYHATFKFEKGRIKTLRAEPHPESAEKMLGVLEAFADWAGEERPEEFQALIPEGKFDYGGETARLIVALLRDWREATKDDRPP